MIKKIYYTGVLLLLSPQVLLAASESTEFTDFKSFVKDFAIPGIIRPLTTFVLVLVVAVFMWGVAKFMLSAGDEKSRAEGRALMTHGILAIFIMVTFWGFVKLLQTTFGW